MTPPTLSTDIQTRYPNLVALVHGQVSGRISEWPRLRTELAVALVELDKLRKAKHDN